MTIVSSIGSSGRVHVLASKPRLRSIDERIVIGSSELPRDYQLSNTHHAPIQYSAKLTKSEWPSETEYGNIKQHPSYYSIYPNSDLSSDLSQLSYNRLIYPNSPSNYRQFSENVEPQRYRLGQSISQPEAESEEFSQTNDIINSISPASFLSQQRINLDQEQLERSPLVSSDRIQKNGKNNNRVDEAIDLLMESLDEGDTNNNNQQAKDISKKNSNGEFNRVSENPKSKPVFSTLLEDEETNSKTPEKVTSPKQDPKKVDEKEVDQKGNKEDGNSYGRIINFESEGNTKSNSNRWNSLLERIYVAALGLLDNTQRGDKIPKVTVNLDNKISTPRGVTKLDVSEPKVKVDKNGNKIDVSETNGNDGTNDKKLADKTVNPNNQEHMKDKQQQQANSISERLGQKATTTKITGNIGEIGSDKRNVDLNENIGSNEPGEIDTKTINSLRSSSLVMPMEGPQDEEILNLYTTGAQDQYRANSGGLRHSLSMNPGSYEGEKRYGSFRSALSRHYTTGEPVYSPFEGAKSFYGSRGPASVNFIPHQGNDVYFLVMVGAFCVMAVAAVLAAGLFAYRVQQSRKTNPETDYPTYGVVGPNNMNGKCIAGGPSFVGGYFNNANPGFGLAGLGKPNNNASIKGSSECFSPNDSGIYGISGKTSSKKSPGDTRPPSFMASQQNAARMYHYQHQKQQMISSERTSSGRHTSASDLDSEEENEDGNYTVYECPGLASAHDMEIKNPLFNDDRSP